MDFLDVVDQVVALLRSRSRITYRASKRQFHLDDDALEEIQGGNRRRRAGARLMSQ